MKKVFIIHGWSGSPDEPMLAWLGNSLKECGFEVITPLMPHSDEPTIRDWVGVLKEVCKNLNEEIYFIGHSIGCQTILRFFETLQGDVYVRKTILIAPWISLTVENLDTNEEVEVAKPWMETPINYEKVSSHSKDFVGIFSDDDPFVPLVENQNLLKEKLHAKTIVLHNKGHFIESDGVTELPEVLEEILI